MSSVPALPGVSTTYWLKSLRLAVSGRSITAFFDGSYGPFSSCSAMLLFAATQPMTKPTPDMPPLTPPAELFRVLLHPLGELGVALRRLLDDVGVVGERDLAVEHRDHVAVDVLAEMFFALSRDTSLPAATSFR